MRAISGTLLTALVIFGLSVLLGAETAAPGPTESAAAEDDGGSSGVASQRFLVEGKVSIPFTADQEWVPATRVVLDGGQYLGFLRSDGSFAVSVPSGSYTIDVSHPVYVFDSVRVDITSKGKIRARRLNNVQPSLVLAVNYPLKVKAKGRASYFQQREQWRIADFLFSPMILTMFLPFVLLMILPKLINTQDPETQKEMQQTMGILNQAEPSGIVGSLYEVVRRRGGNTKKVAKNKPAKKRP